MVKLVNTPEVLKAVKEIQENVAAITDDLINSDSLESIIMLEKEFSKKNNFALYRELICNKLQKYECEKIIITPKFKISMDFLDFEIVIDSCKKHCEIGWRITQKGYERLWKLQYS